MAKCRRPFFLRQTGCNLRTNIDFGHIVTIQTATATRLDDITAGAIREALAAAQAGRLEDACAIAERALVNGGDSAALNALLGTLRLRNGEPERALPHLETAHDRKPHDLRIAANLATVLLALDQFDRALKIASRERAFADPTLQLARLRGAAAAHCEDFTAAVEALEHVVARNPNDWESWNNLGNFRRGADDYEGSVEALRRSLDINPEPATTRMNYANSLRDCGRFEEAETIFRQLADELPNDTAPLRELHLLLKDSNRSDEALKAIDDAIERAPDNVELLLTKATYLGALHKMDAAETVYRRVLGIEPNDEIAYLGLALVYELTNRVSELEALQREVEERGIHEDAINFIRAYCFRRGKKFAEGIAALESVSDDLETPRRRHLLGQLLEGAGRYDEAFATFSRMNEVMSEDASQPVARAAAYRDLIRKFHETVTKEWVDSWREEAVPDAWPAPVFLVGFPRSGTTLLDTILMSHPQTEVLEEEPALRHALETLPEIGELPTLPDERIKAARETYIQTAASLTPLAPGKLLIDKNPLTLNLLPFVRRLFPEAKIILALRHPCDVLLSCYFANFALNEGMSNFLRLDTAAELYDLSFGYHEHVQKLMPLPTHVVKYENIVADRARELSGLFDFLGLDWHDAVMDHQKTALSRGRIKTASYSQVVEPIYTRSAGRWQNYRKHLEPVLPVLEPWARKFGYSIDES